MKRWIIWAFALSLLISCMPALTLPASAAETVASGSCGASINWILTDDGILTIAGTGAMYDYTTSSSKYSPWFVYKDSIIGVIFTGTISHIGNASFYNHCNLISVVFPSSLTTIGNYAFFCCDLGEIFLPNSVTTIGSFAFYHNDRLTVSSWPSSLIMIGNNAFAYSAISYAVFPEGLNSIGSYAFTYCDNIVDVYLPSTLELFQSAVFSQCSSLTTVYCLASNPPTSSTSGGFFSGCSQLSAIYVPSGSLDAYMNDEYWSAYSGFLYLSNNGSGGSGDSGDSGSGDDGSVTDSVMAVWVHNYGGTLAPGSVVQFYVEVAGSGTYDDSVVWSLYVAGNDEATTLDQNGLLQIGAAESASWLCVKATSVQDPTIYGLGSIRINYSSDGSSGSDGSGGSSGEYDEDFAKLDQSVAGIQNSVDNVSDKVDEMPDKITDGMSSMYDEMDQEAESQGNEYIDQVIDVIPDESEGFLDALMSLIDVVKYDGTAAVLTMPDIKIPAIGDLFPETTLLEEQEIDFEYWINEFVPDILLTVIRALFDAALTIYCFKELAELIGNAVNGFGGEMAKGLYDTEGGW